MSQAQKPDFNIDPYSTSGVELTNIMNRLHQAHISAHSGPGRPPYAVVGTIWLDNTTPPGQLLWFDGANDLPLGGGGAAAGAITNYDATKTYSLGDLVVQGGNIYKNVTAVAAAEPFDPFKWKQIDSGGVVQAITPFDPAAAYKAGDMVTNTGMVYVAKAAITTPGPFSATDWNQIAPGSGATGPITLFGATKTYTLDDIVVYQGKIYRNIVPVTVPSPFKQTEWVEIDIGGLVQVITAHDPTAVYAQNDLVALNGIIYRANAAIPAEPFDSTKWTQIAPAGGGGAIDTWVATKNYLQNDIVVHSGHIYRAKAAAPMNATFDATKWEEIGGKQAPDVLTAFSPTMNYTTGQLVVYGSKIYRSNALVNPGPWDASKWDEIDIGAAPPAGVKLHDVTLSYAQGDLVAHLGHIYRALAAIAPKAFDPTDWKQIDLEGLKMPVTFYDPTITYKAGDIIAQGGKLYKADTTVTGPFDPTKWTQIDATKITQAITNFDSTKTYAQNDLVVDGGSIYRAVHATGPGARVTADWQQIDADAIIHPVNDFDQTATYKVDDIVINSGDIYRATKAITAGPFNAADWHKFDEHPIKAYDPTQTYKVGDAVMQGGKVWVNKTAIATPEPFTPLNWFDLSHVSISEWYPAGVYAQSDLVTNGGKIYKAKAAVPASATFDPTKWDEVGARPPSQVLTAFSATVPYKQDHLVVENGKIYRAKADNGPAAFAAANWEEIDIGGEKPQAITIHDVTQAYKANALVTHLGNIYRAKIDIPAKPWSAGDWDQIGAGGPIEEYDPAKLYKAFSIVTHQGRIYMLNPPIKPPAPWDAKVWTEVGAASLSVGGQVFTAIPANTIGIDGDFIGVSALIPAQAIFRTPLAAGSNVYPATFAIAYPSSFISPMPGTIGTAGGKKWVDSTGSRATVTLNNDTLQFNQDPGKTRSGSTILKWEVGGYAGRQDIIPVNSWSGAIGHIYHKADPPPADWSGSLKEWTDLFDIGKLPASWKGGWFNIRISTTASHSTVKLYQKEGGVWKPFVLGSVAADPDTIALRDSEGALETTSITLDPTEGKYIDGKKNKRQVYIGHGAGAKQPTKAGGAVVIGLNAGLQDDTTTVVEQNGDILIGHGAGTALAGTLAKPAAYVASITSNIHQRIVIGASFGQMTNLAHPIKADYLVAIGDNISDSKYTGMQSMFGCTFVGGSEYPSTRTVPSKKSLVNVTTLGYGAQWTGKDNEIVLGNHHVAKLYCKQRAITAVSDERDKKDIADLSLGLDFINGLRPVSFEWDDRDGSYKGVKSIGFIAQEVLKAENDSGMRDHLQMVDDWDQDKLKMSDGQLIPILTKAVQELSAQVEALKTEIDNLKKSA